MLSVCMIVKNEEALLARCLESVKGADELIICDTGSTDKTVEIARQYTDKVFTDYTWNDNFAEARNHVLAKATGDWVLSIDGDQYMASGGMGLIREAIRQHPEWKTISCRLQAETTGSYHYNIRLFQRIPEIFWCGEIHNYMSLHPQGSCEATIIYGYSPAHKNDPDRALRILRKVVQEKPTRAREWYYLGREHWYRKQYEEAISAFDSCLKYSKFLAERADAHLLKARCLWSLRHGEEARQDCLLAININANFKEAVLFMAEMSWEHNAKTWRAFAEHCTNENVLFVRESASAPKKGRQQDSVYYDKLWSDPGYQVSAEKLRWYPIWTLTAARILEDSRAGIKQVIDLGCGPGHFASVLSRLVNTAISYTGYDFSSVAIDAARRRKPDHRFSFVQADLSSHEFNAAVPEKCNDPVTYVAIEFFEHVNFDLDVIKRMRPDTPLLFSVPNFDDPGHVRTFKTEEDIRNRYAGLMSILDIKRMSDGYRFFVEARTRRVMVDLAR